MMFIEARNTLLNYKEVKLSNGNTSKRYVKPNKKEVSLVLDSLENYYAPTVEMTKEGYATLMTYLDTATLQDFFSFVVDDYQRFNELYDELTIEDLMTVWLFPDTAKVVGQ